MDLDLGFLLRLYYKLRVRPFLFEECACRIYHKERLPEKGPAIIIANHGSLIDGHVIHMQYPPAMLASVLLTGARDFFEKKGWLETFIAKYILRVCFVDRDSGEAAKAGKRDSFAEFHKPLAAGNILIYFPQGTRDEGAAFQPGIFHLAKAYPGVPIIPVLLEGTRRMHPKGVPFYKMYSHLVSVYVGKEFPFDPSLTPREYAAKLQRYVYSLDQER